MNIIMDRVERQTRSGTTVYACIPATLETKAAGAGAQEVEARLSNSKIPFTKKACSHPGHGDGEWVWFDGESSYRG